MAQELTFTNNPNVADGPRASLLPKQDDTFASPAQKTNLGVKVGPFAHYRLVDSQW